MSRRSQEFPFQTAVNDNNHHILSQVLQSNFSKLSKIVMNCHICLSSPKNFTLVKVLKKHSNWSNSTELFKIVKDVEKSQNWQFSNIIHLCILYIITKPHRPESIPRLIVQVKPVSSNDSKYNIGLSTTGQDLGVGDVHFS